MFKVFSIPGGMVITAMLCILVGEYHHTGVWLWVCVGLYCFGKLAIAMSFAQGYGVKKGVNVIAGMPIVLAVFIFILAIIIGKFIHWSYQPMPFLPATIANLRSCGWSMAIGLGVALCHWYVYARKRYFCQSEYNIRCECRASGKSQEETEAIVANYRAQGIIKR